MSRHRRGFQWALWGGPIMLAVVSTVGLISALLGDGVWDFVSWLALGLPVAVCALYGTRGRREARGASSTRLGG